MRRVMVAGAGGGIGHALVDALAAREQTQAVYALHRRPVSSTSDKVRWLQADLCDAEALDHLAARVQADGGLDGLIVASGLLHGQRLRPEKSLAEIDAQNLLDLYTANAIAPLLLLKASRDLFARSPKPFICLLSAQLGSIEDNRLGGWYGYRMAKAALNMAVRTAAVELARQKSPPTVVAVHPGTTRTALSNPIVGKRARSIASPRQAAADILRLIDTLDPALNGSFLNRDGRPLPW